MGIRMLHRRAAPPRSGADGPRPEASVSVPVFADAASTARIPTPLSATLRRHLPATGAPAIPWRLWAEVARGYLTLVLTLLPRPRPVRTITVFVAAGETLSVRPYGSAAPYPRLQGGSPWPGRPDATP
ncbi:hypothetical protein N4P33_11695 [Streptomyces sp. 15-116A]|uniref:hypothetical protein n=1 Tax=Streptomyces sp. 15-116A TaxID=2259035 RepID=UPI0021B326A7|nr:hypothetical protein [Streptomyces sp. 15-116A]MCT7352828.1 hypothetical protein [Streptomyces sp. 15-116A]